MVIQALELYRRVYEELLAVPVIMGKREREREKDCRFLDVGTHAALSGNIRTVVIFALVSERPFYFRAEWYSSCGHG